MKYYFLFIIFLTNCCWSQNSLDYQLLNHINEQATSQGIHFNQLLSASDTPISLGIPLVLGIHSAIAKNKSNGIICGEQLATHFINSTITIGIKYVVQRPRPFITYPTIEKYGKAGSLSFPSGHTSMAFATATTLSMTYPKWYIIIPSYAWACSVGFSRMYLGVHYPSDVVVGALVGTSSALIVHFLVSKYKNSIFVKRHRAN